MPLDTGNLKLPTKIPTLAYQTLGNWKMGVITLIDKSRVPTNALIEAKNCFLREDGIPSPRPGVDWYGTAPSSSAIDGGFLYYTDAGVPHLIVVAGGTVYRSTNDGTSWSTCSGATLTSGSKVYAVQDHSYLYLTNKADNIVRYDGTTTLVTYTALTSPAAPTIVETGLVGTGYNHYYKATAVNTVGFTVASAASAVVQSALNRSNWSAATNNAALTIAATAGASRYDLYVSEDNVDYFYLDTVIPATVGGAATYMDDGSAPVQTNILAPVDNTTQGPIIQRLEQIGTRLWGVNDLNNPWRVWFSGSGQYAGYFSSAYDGGYIDLMKGSQYRPVRVVDYRDGKGTPYATVWMKSPDGRGCIWQISLETLTVGTITFTAPNAFRLPGSRGTDAPESVVNVLNDYVFYNSQAFYNLGNQRNMPVPVLSTDESSANIRPTVRGIDPVAASGICSIYFEARIYFSVPYGSSTNNTTTVYDTEQKAWLPEAFTIGFERFLQYPDTAGSRHLLAWKPGDTRLSQISDSIKGDYGQAFAVSLTTGLYPTTKNRFDFMFEEEAEVEFSQPQGSIVVELIGIERTAGYGTIKSETITAAYTTTNTGHDTFLHDSSEHDLTAGTIATLSESSVKRYFTVQKELNAYQWHVSCYSADAYFLLRTLQLSGRSTNAGKPRAWRLV